MKVEVDQERCSWTPSRRPQQHENVRDAAAGCPAAAITVVE